MKGEIEIAISYGEVMDRVTILEIKKSNIGDADKIKNIDYELSLINKKIEESQVVMSEGLIDLKYELLRVNKNIWDGENLVRECDRARSFGPDFIEMACRIRRWNDERARIKRDINTILGSTIIEEKGHDI